MNQIQKQRVSILTVSVFLGSLGNTALAANQEDVQKFFAANKVGRSPDYALVKNGIAGPDHLVTIHGYADDKSVCEAIAKQYNEDKLLSVVPGTYQCIPLNK